QDRGGGRAHPSLAESHDVAAGRPDGAHAQNDERRGQADDDVPVIVLPVDPAEVDARNQCRESQDAGNYAATKIRALGRRLLTLGGRPDFTHDTFLRDRRFRSACWWFVTRGNGGRAPG